MAEPAGRGGVVHADPGPGDQFDGGATPAAFVLGGGGVCFPLGPPAAGVDGQVEPGKRPADRAQGDDPVRVAGDTGQVRGCAMDLAFRS